MDLNRMGETIGDLAILWKWARAHEDIDVDLYGLTLMVGSRDYQFNVLPKEELARRVRAMKELGPVKKAVWGQTMSYEVRLDSGVSLQMTVDREVVCTKREVGTETKTIPDPEAPTIEVEVPVYEWDCHPLLEEAAE